MRHPPDSFVSIDRAVWKKTDGSEAPPTTTVTDLSKVAKFVLLGEPGSGKSTVLRQAAEAEGARVVKAADFVQGEHPPGTTAYIDALEEFQLGEPLRDRFSQLVKALKAASYGRWRIACRAMSFPRSEENYIADQLGAHEVWHLAALDNRHVTAILGHFGEPDPAAFTRRVAGMGAAPLMGNPATLWLLHETLTDETEAVSTRGELLAKATLRMAHELNEDIPDDPNRPTAGSILDAAATACLVLLLSGKTDIWAAVGAAPPRHVVTFDDLLPAQVSTDALRTALNTPMFRGEAGSYMPTHRIVAEYLGGKALAEAVEGGPARAALPLERALAFLNGAGDRPAPALTGLFAWFVCFLSNTGHSLRALELVSADPESVVFHGDPAALPVEHRRALLASVGRKDPWFLMGAPGSSALGGLSGEDLADDLAAVLFNPGESNQRRAMVASALAMGRPVPSLLEPLRRAATDPAAPEWLRRGAIDALTHMATDPTAVRRDLLAALEGEPSRGPAMLRLRLLAPLVGHGPDVGAIRRAIADHSSSGTSVSGYLRPLGDALAATPLPALFDERFEWQSDFSTRRHEAKHMLSHALAAAVAKVPDLDADRILLWLRNLCGSSFSLLGEEVVETVGEWVIRKPGNALALFDAIVASMPPDQRWIAGSEYYRITGSFPPREVRTVVVERLESVASTDDLDALKRAALVASHLASPRDAYPDLHHRVLEVALSRPEELGDLARWMTAPPDNRWEVQQAAAEEARHAEKVKQKGLDREWLSENEVLVRSGKHFPLLSWAAGILIHPDAFPSTADGDPLAAWCGDEGAADIRAGWAALADDFPISPQDQGRSAARTTDYNLNVAAAVHLSEAAASGISRRISVPFAFAALRGSYAITPSELHDAVVRKAVERILAHDDGRRALCGFWFAALRARAQELPYLAVFEQLPLHLAQVLKAFLEHRPACRSSALLSAVGSAMRALPADEVDALANAALARPLPRHARKVWSFVAFLMASDPDDARFEAEIGEVNSHQLFKELYGVTQSVVLDFPPETHLRRDAIVARHLGRMHPPARGLEDMDSVGRVAEAALVRIAQSPLPLAGELLGELYRDMSLLAWQETIRHHASSQDRLRRETEFKVPLPRDVAAAFRAGPPATPSDVQAVVREVLEDLARDIKHGDTSPWRGFWNRPHGGESTPKTENECRDLLTDRLRDRLRPFRIPAKLVSTETRSGNDRRADLVVLGEGSSAIPIEAKRHYNEEIWTAMEVQLVPYSRTLNSANHGIYLIFWFGKNHCVRKAPPGFGTITTPQSLKAALERVVPSEMRGRCDVIVIDVADQTGPKEEKPRKGRRKRPPAPGAETKAIKNAL